MPLEAIALVAGIDRINDGLKTVVNIIGNSVNAIILSHWEAEKNSEVEGLPVLKS
ncbi:MAG: cation:dicarboxylate symporter family transporter [Pseudanabaena sp.]